MLLKIFTKIQKNGKPVKTGEEWKTTYYEADEIYIDMPENDENITKFKVVFNEEESVLGQIELDYQGYELYNSKGVIIDRFISKKNL